MGKFTPVLHQMRELWDKDVNLGLKGEEVAGHSKNIDMQVVNNFNAFKNYAKKYYLKWRFVYQ